MQKNEVYLDSYPLQKDLRIRLPKQIVFNLPIEVGSMFDIYYDTISKDIILRASPPYEKAKSEISEEKK